MLRKLWVLALPLLIRLLAYSALFGGLVALGLVACWVIGGAEVAEQYWARARAGVLAIGTFYVGFTIVVWLLHLAGLRRKLREKQTSLREFASWPTDVRNAWIKAD